MTTGRKTIIKGLSIVVLASVTMANKKCEEAPPRQLKRNIKVVGMEASKFMDSPEFSFSEVAQSQLSGVFFENEQFFERNTYPVVSEEEGLAVQSNGLQKIAVVNNEVQSKTVAQLKTWFPEMKTEEVQDQSGFSRKSSCLVSRPQHLLQGKINSLEALGGGALQFGFNMGSSQTPLGLNFKIDLMRMDLSMNAFDPWSGQQMAAVNSKVIKKDYGAGLDLSYNGIGIGLNFYRDSGMAETTLKGLRTLVSDTYNNLAALPRQEWQTRVLLSRDNYVVIVGGAELGLKKGDRLKVENEIHDWQGEPCGQDSVLLGSTSVTSNPWIIEVEDAGNLMSKAKVLNIDENSSIDVGALVRIDKLYVEPTTISKKKKK